MKLISIDHVQIAIPAGGEDSARSFYLDVLGFNEIPKPAELATRGGVWFRSENVQLHLGIEPNFQPAQKAHPAFIVDDLNSFIAKAENAGFKTDTSQPALDGFLRLYRDQSLV